MKLAVALGLLAVVAGCARDKNKREQKQAEHEKRAEVLIAELKDLGFSLDKDQLRIEVKRPLEARADLDRQQSMFFRDSYFAGMHHLHRRLGLVVANDPKQFRELAVLGVSQTMQAYYQPDRKALVFLENALDQLGHMDTLVAHEVAHAIQDQRDGGLQGLLSRYNGTLDGSSVAQCLIEGEAEVVSAAVLLARQGRSLDDLRAGDFEYGFERAMAGTTSLVYSIGRRYVLDAYHHGGWKAVAAAIEAPIASTEQVMHPQKRADEPTRVELPDPPAALEATSIHDDVLGELNIYSLMLELGVSDRDAYIAAAGWDGDRLRIWDIPGNDAALAWRIVWDRVADAEQFERTFPRGRFSLRRQGRITDLYSGPSALEIDDVLPPPEPPAENPGEAETAARVEADHAAELAEGPAVIDGRWVHARYGLSIPIPPGWRNIEFQGVELLAGSSEGGFADNITVGAMPNIQGYDLSGFRKENESTFGKIDTVRLIQNQRAKVGARDVLVFEYEGTLPTATQRLHFSGFLFIDGDQYVIVTVTVLASRWSNTRATVRDVIARTTLN